MSLPENSFHPDAYLIAHVSRPQFAVKLASYGQTPINSEELDRTMAGAVVVDRAVAAVKAALDLTTDPNKNAVDALLGPASDPMLEARAQALQKAASAEALQVPGVRDAALAYLAGLWSGRSS